MKSLHTVFEVIAWIVLAIVLYALSPLLLILLSLASRLHHLFGN